MTATLLGSEAVGFADGNGGHVYNIPLGAPNVGETDVLCVNSNTVVATPSGFQLRVNATNDQGAYIFTRKAVGGEAATITITTTGNHNTELTWSRWSNVDAFSAANFVRVDNVNGTSLPATSTGALATTNMLLIAYAALHSFDAAAPTSPVWTNSFTPLQAGSQGGPASATSVASFTGYKTNAGTAAETINSVTWTNNARQRYALWISFTTLSVTGAAVTGTAAVTLPELDVDLAGAVAVTGTAGVVLPALEVDLGGDVAVTGVATITLPTISAAITGSVAVSGELDVDLPTLSFAATGSVVQDVTGDLEATLPDLEVDLQGEGEVIDIFSESFAIVTGVGMCALDALARTEWGMPTRVCLAVPGDIAWDDCQCGQFAQSITTEVPSENFPFPATDRRSTACGPAFLVVTVVASLTRCVETFDRSNKPPTCDVLLRAARRLEDDRTALRYGITCCLRDLRQAYRITDFTVGAATSVGPDGACVGVEITYQFAVKNVCCE